MPCEISDILGSLWGRGHLLLHTKQTFQTIGPKSATTCMPMECLPSKKNRTSKTPENVIPLFSTVVTDVGVKSLPPVFITTFFHAKSPEQKIRCGCFDDCSQVSWSGHALFFSRVLFWGVHVHTLQSFWGGAGLRAEHTVHGVNGLRSTDTPYKTVAFQKQNEQPTACTGYFSGARVLLSCVRSPLQKTKKRK